MRPATALLQLRSGRDVLRLAGSVSGLGVGGTAWLLGAGTAADAVWVVTTMASLVPTSVTTARDLLRRRAGVDIVAVLALAGSLVVGEYIAGAVIALMLSSGRWLEARASARARRELGALLEHAPSVVHRVEGDTLTTPPLESVRPGDLLLVAPGEIVPVDGQITGLPALLDESALTGEAALVERPEGDPVRSGAVNAGGPFRLRATCTSAESTYAGIVRLVRQAEASRAPLIRLADRFAMWFVPLTLLVGAAAALVARDPVRGVAVLVVATPCPLILAAPVALVAGMSRAARRGVIIKSGAALETLGRADILLFDKTGTLTAGRARVAAVETGGELDADEVLRLAASLDQVSVHALAVPIVRAAQGRGLQLEMPDEVIEEHGRGISGRIGRARVVVGRADYVVPPAEVPVWARRVRRRTAYEGMANVFVSVDGTLTGAIVLEDPIRPDAARTLQRLRQAGIRRLVMVTGDHPEVADSVASALGVDAVHSERSPADKVEVVAAERRQGTVIMVGDGINDAPALATADVGVAMGARGASASSEAADVVLVVDRLDRLGDALVVARRSHRIAVQSIASGMGLSGAAMVVAAFGFLVPVVGALVQEAIDVAVILNALRARSGGSLRNQPPPALVLAGRQILTEHAALRRGTARIRETADELGSVPPGVAMTHLREVMHFLDAELLPHEREEEMLFYPLVVQYTGDDQSVTTVRRVHAEISHLAHVLGRMVDDIGGEGPTADDLPGLRRVLYGLHAVLGLHRATEEEEHVSGVVDDAAVDEMAG